MQIIFYGNGGSGNHGCEAIVRGTSELLKPWKPDCLILSDNCREDAAYGLGQIGKIEPSRYPVKKDPAFLSAYIKLKLFGNYTQMDGLPYLTGIRRHSACANLALSVGGDNYCYGGTELYGYLNRQYRRAGVDTVLWGCSIEPEITEKPGVARDLANYCLIAARESITYEACRRRNPNTILMPDPAFFMPYQACALDERLESGRVIGVNASPLILKCGQQSELVYQNYVELISTILRQTDDYVALIPHVVWQHNDDRTVLEALYRQFQGEERIILVADHTAPELKYIISKCRFFVGARTHATIAAYSSGVPTLAVGYSVKARGIARDLFGSEEHYVLPVQTIRQPNELSRAFCRLMEQEKQIRTHLEQVLPDYCAGGIHASEILIQQAGKKG